MRAWTRRVRAVSKRYDLEMKLLGADGGDGLRQYLASIWVPPRSHPLLRAGWRSWSATAPTWRASSDTGRSGIAIAPRCSRSCRGYDVILCPAYIHPALPHGASTLDENFRGFSHTMAYNLTGWPAAVVRCGESAAGLPIAVQVVARPWREDVALAVAAWLEGAFGGWKAPADAGLRQ